MQVIWSPTAQCRGFLALSRQVITVVSSNLAKEAVGKSVSGGLTVVVDSGGGFCDLELALRPEYRLPSPLLPQAPTKVRSPLVTILEPHGHVRWFLDESSGYVAISFIQARVENWFDIGSGLTIGTRAEGMLTAVVLHGVVEDPAGKLEAAWLDEIESLAGPQTT
jgi:hypothetical protein